MAEGQAFCGVRAARCSSAAKAETGLKVSPDAKMFDVQPHLPRLPVPDLDQTLATYLDLVKPLATEPEFEECQFQVKQFAEEVGPALQKQLLARKAEADTVAWDSDRPVNWLEEWWETLAYLSIRDPMMVNLNVFSSCFEATPHPHPLQRAAEMIHSTAVMKGRIDRREYKPDHLKRDGGMPLCMSLFPRAFCTTRVPGEEMDELVTHTGSRHVVIVRDTQFFKIIVENEDGSVLSPGAIHRQLQQVVAQADALRSEGRLRGMPQMASLTYDARPEWCATRKHLQSNATNAASLEAIESAMFVVSLSRESPEDEPELVNLALAGNEEVWADKSFSLIVTENGRVGYNGEHSATDGTVVSRIMLDCRDYERAHRYDFEAKVEDEGATPELLEWESDDIIRKAYHRAHSVASVLTSDLQITCSVFNDFGAKMVKEMKLSPDSFMQMALQLAFYRDQGCFVATYESGLTRLFMRGRTETVRPLSTAAMAFVRTMEDESSTVSETVAALRQACAVHSQYVKRCAAGQGIDRHLLGLRVLASGCEEPVPMFTSPLFAKFNHFVLSTSQIGYPSVEYCGFGPPTPDAYGVCYNCALPDKLLTIISARHSCSGKDAVRFTGVVEQALRDVFKLLQSYQSRL